MADKREDEIAHIPASNRWLERAQIKASDYDSAWSRMAAQGKDPHGEAGCVMRLRPTDLDRPFRVLDAGCGTGRVAIELARRGCDVVGVDLDPRMLDRAREKAPELDWRLGNLATIDLGRRFELIVMAGNVMIFVAPGSEAAVVADLARHLEPGGLLVAGFQLTTPYTLARYDADAEAAGLTLARRWSTWDGDPWTPGGNYAVSVHQAGAQR